MTTTKTPKRCNLANYLLEQEVVCRRMEQSTHSDSPAGREWNRIAETLLSLRVAHGESCAKCQS